MAKNFIQNGKVIDYANASGSDVTSGSLVAIGGMVGVALIDIADGDIGSVGVSGVYEVSNGGSAAIAQGDELFFDATTGAVDGVNTSNQFAGLAWQAADASSSTVLLRLSN